MHVSPKSRDPKTPCGPYETQQTKFHHTLLWHPKVPLYLLHRQTKQNTGFETKITMSTRKPPDFCVESPGRPGPTPTPTLLP